MSARNSKKGTRKSRDSAKATPKREQTRALIYETALQLFQREGFEATTMRAIAEAAGLSAGAAYYHFQSKNDLVLEFYVQSEAELRSQMERICASSPDFFERLEALLVFRLEQFETHRKFVGVLFQNAIEPDSPLSPFHPEMLALREEAVAVFAHLLDSSRLKILPELRPHCPHLLWLYQLGILLFWLHDLSPNRRRTRRLIQLSMLVLRQLLRLQRLPFARQLTRSVIELLAEFSLRNNAANAIGSAKAPVKSR
ncbi:MAG: TetR family transcriptional regulator [bacterium]|nr:TetR family transcriptional regulator [bacterium]